MAEINFNNLYDQLSPIDQMYYDQQFSKNYVPGQQNMMLESKPAYDQMKAVYDAQQKVPEKGFFDSLNFFSEAGAAEPEKYGIGSIDMGAYYTPEQQALMFGDPNYFGNNQTNTLPFTSMADMAAANQNFMNQFNTETGTDLSLEDAFPGMNTGDIIDSMNDRQKVNRFSGMGEVGPNKSNMIGNTIVEEVIDENRIPGRIQESVPNYQNLFQRMMSGAKNKLGDVYGKTKELGTRFREGAKPVFGLASMFANATDPLNPDAFNYNPDLAAQLNFMDQNFGGSMVNNPTSGLLQYAQGTPLEGQNVMSLFGSNDPVKQLEKQLARRQKTYDNLGNQWSSLEGLNIDPDTGLDDLDRKKQTYFDKFLNPTTSWLGKVKADQKVRIDKRNVALAIKEAQKEARKKSNQNQSSTINYGKKQGTTGSWTPGGTYSAPAPQRDYSKHSAYGLKDGGLVSLFTRRG